MNGKHSPHHTDICGSGPGIEYAKTVGSVPYTLRKVTVDSATVQRIALSISDKLWRFCRFSVVPIVVIAWEFLVDIDGIVLGIPLDSGTFKNIKDKYGQELFVGDLYSFPE